MREDSDERRLGREKTRTREGGSAETRAARQAGRRRKRVESAVRVGRVKCPPMPQVGHGRVATKREARVRVAITTPDAHSNHGVMQRAGVWVQVFMPAEGLSGVYHVHFVYLWSVGRRIKGAGD